MPIGSTGADTLAIGSKITYELVKLSGDLLRKLLEALLKHMENSPGKKSLQNLLASGKELKTIQMNKDRLKDFNKLCKQYGIQFSAVGERSGDKKCIIFKIEDLDRMERVLDTLVKNELDRQEFKDIFKDIRESSSRDDYIKPNFEKSNLTSEEWMNKIKPVIYEKFSNKENYKDFLNDVSKFNKYSCNNILLIKEQAPNATDVAGYRKWNDNGRNVLDGTKAITVLAPIIEERKVLIDKNDLSKGVKIKKELVGFNQGYVFDISQTEGKELAKDTINEKQLLSSLKVIDSQFKLDKAKSDNENIKSSLDNILNRMCEDKFKNELDKEFFKESVKYTVVNKVHLENNTLVVNNTVEINNFDKWKEGKGEKEFKGMLESIQKESNYIINSIEKEVSREKDISLEPEKENVKGINKNVDTVKKAKEITQDAKDSKGDSNDSKTKSPEKSTKDDKGSER